MNEKGELILELWFTAEMYGETTEAGKQILQYYCPAYYNDISFDNILVGKIKLNNKWQFIQLAQDFYLMGNLPFYEEFMIRNNEMDEDFKVCKIKPEYLKNGWNFTKGTWLSNSYCIARKFGYDWIPDLK